VTTGLREGCVQSHYATNNSQGRHISNRWCQAFLTLNRAINCFLVQKCMFIYQRMLTIYLSIICSILSSLPKSNIIVLKLLFYSFMIISPKLWVINKSLASHLFTPNHLCTNCFMEFLKDPSLVLNTPFLSVLSYLIQQQTITSMLMIPNFSIILSSFNISHLENTIAYPTECLPTSCYLILLNWVCHFWSTTTTL